MEPMSSWQIQLYNTIRNLFLFFPGALNFGDAFEYAFKNNKNRKKQQRNMKNKKEQKSFTFVSNF